MATVVETDERVHKVHIEGLALLKIVKHCHESLPSMVTGSLLGMTNGQGVLEVTHAFPFPNENRKAAAAAAATEGGATTATTPTVEEEAVGLEGHEFQLEMMRMLREVNVDNNCVGWYQSIYLGMYSTSSLLEGQLSYQTDLSPNAVVILYDPMQTTHGSLVLKCYRLSDETLKAKNNGRNKFIEPKNIFEQVPIQITNTGLVRALLSDIATNHGTPIHTEGSIAGGGAAGIETCLDRLDLSTNPYLEKNLEFCCKWVDDLASENSKFQYYTRQLVKTGGGKGGGRLSKHDAWEATEAPARMESLLASNQIQTYVDQMEQFATGGLTKLYLLGGLHSTDN